MILNARLTLVLTVGVGGILMGIMPGHPVEIIIAVVLMICAGYWFFVMKPAGRPEK